MRETEPGATTTYVTEPEKQVPIVHDVDVLVAGAGVSGVFAAIAAARNGARTAIVDRFGNVGGNIGPGVIAGGGMLSGRSHPDAGYNNSVYPELYGIGREFIDEPPFSLASNHSEAYVSFLVILGICIVCAALSIYFLNKKELE